MNSKIKSYGIWGPVVFILIYQIRIFLLLPISVISTIAGAVWGLTGLIYILIALSICLTTEFFIARYLARDTAQRLFKNKVDYLNRFIIKNAFMTVLVIRLIPNVVLDVQNVVLALTKVKYREYYTASILGLLPGTFALVYFGDSLVSMIIQPQHRWKIILAILLLYCLYGAQKYLREKLKTHDKGFDHENTDDDQHLYADCRRG